MTLFAQVIELLSRHEATDIKVFGGGIIPDADIPELLALGVAAVFTPGTTTAEIIAWVREHVRRSD
jgi:methylmalonyl-CoA mutase, C-terminal domain